MNLLAKIRLIPIRFWGNIYFQKAAIKKAKKLHQQTGCRYRVFFLEKRYQVLTRQDIQRAKHERRFAPHVNSTNMQPLCFFDTNHVVQHRRGMPRLS